MDRLGHEGRIVSPKPRTDDATDSPRPQGLSRISSCQSREAPSRIQRVLGVSCPSPEGSTRTHRSLDLRCSSPEGSPRIHRSLDLRCSSPEGSPRIHRSLELRCSSPEGPLRTYGSLDLRCASPEGPPRIHHRTMVVSCPSPEGYSRIHRTLDMSYPSTGGSSRMTGMACPSPERSSRISGVSCASPEGAPEVTASRQLKFGMDRILSEDISPLGRRSSHSDLSSPPCSQCVSSLLRCCRLGPPYPGSYYPAQIHAPRPIRPYNNLVVSDGVHLSPADRGGSTAPGNKRKRSWSRAVFSNLQRKGLEKRFQLQKYITKPDRRQLAATLGLTDAQVKVWFQNRRMKWRHSKEAKHEGDLAVMSVERREEQGRPDSTQEPEIDVQTVDM